MPKNNNLEAINLPMEVKFNQPPKTNFKNNLDSIKVELLEGPTMDQLRSYLPQFILATWAPTPDANDNLPLREKDRVIREALEGKALPTALETINLTFRLSGISLQEVTHILRHRMASFSADCSGDKWWSDKDALVPNSIENSNGWGSGDYKFEDDFHGRYEAIVRAAKQLYCDMINSKKISIMDARYILPRCLETFYYMRITLKDCIAFIKQRMDKQIQPETDNVMAYLMYIELLKRYPIMHGLIDMHAPSMFYTKMARTGKATNLYFPDKDSDKYEWNENDIIYQCERSELNGTDASTWNKFEQLMDKFDHVIEGLNRCSAVKLEAEYVAAEKTAAGIHPIFQDPEGWA